MPRDHLDANLRRQLGRSGHYAVSYVAHNRPASTKSAGIAVLNCGTNVGVALVKKGSRRIVVDGMAYRWQLRGRPFPARIPGRPRPRTAVAPAADDTL